MWLHAKLDLSEEVTWSTRDKPVLRLKFKHIGRHREKQKRKGKSRATHEHEMGRARQSCQPLFARLTEALAAQGEAACLPEALCLLAKSTATSTKHTCTKAQHNTQRHRHTCTFTQDKHRGTHTHTHTHTHRGTHRGTHTHTHTHKERRVSHGEYTTHTLSGKSKGAGLKAQNTKGLST